MISTSYAKLQILIQSVKILQIQSVNMLPSAGHMLLTHLITVPSIGYGGPQPFDAHNL